MTTAFIGAIPPGGGMARLASIRLTAPDARARLPGPIGVGLAPWRGLGRRSSRLEGPHPPDIPDWRDGCAYGNLLEAERSAFAWEWLRRQRGYREAAIAAIEATSAARFLEQGRAVRWNLHAFEDPRLPVPLARPVWAAPRHRWIVGASVHCASVSDDLFDLGPLARCSRLIRGGATERLLLSDGRRQIRLDATGASLAEGPVSLSFKLAGVRTLEHPLLVLRRLRSLVMTGRFVRSLYPPFQRARRMILVLRTFDAIQAGASQADIAEHLLQGHFERDRWRAHSPSVRSQAQRLVRTATEMSSYGFWDLLD